MTLNKIYTCLLTVTLALASCGENELRSVSSLGHIQIDGLTISAPLFPRSQALYDIETPNYPETPTAVRDWLDTHDVIYSFEEMLAYCNTIDPYAAEIRLPTDGELSPEDIINNYHAVASCSYDRAVGFESKPHWIPQIIIDVNVCGNELGEDWTLMTEEFVLSREPSFFEALADTHTAEDEGADHASFYFSLAVFVVGDEGGLKVATLEPGSPEPARVRNLPDGTDYERHIEQPFGREERNSWYDQTIVVRCLKM